MGLRIRMIIGALLLCTGGVAAAASYDGRWSVVATPQAGGCDGTYVIPVEVRGTEVTYIGRAAMRAEGGISEDGRVEVSFIQGNDQLDARGSMVNPRLANGSWSSPTEDCKGTWIARRR